jgi:hypothetical protein
MSRLKWNKITIWENKERIKDLTFWRDLWLEGTFPSDNVLVSPATGRPFSPEERRVELNRRIPAVREMVALAEVPTIRDWMTFGKDPKPVRVDILEQFWYVETLRVSYRAPADVVDEAIGKYQADQRRSRIRTFNPLHWFGRLIDWLVGKAFNIVTLFGGNPETARRSSIGRINNRSRTIYWLDCRYSRCDRNGPSVFRIR